MSDAHPPSARASSAHDASNRAFMSGTATTPPQRVTVDVIMRQGPDAINRRADWKSIAADEWRPHRVGTSLTRRLRLARRTQKSPASHKAGAWNETFRLFADADHAHGARTVHLLHQVAVRCVVHVARAVAPAEAVAPAVMVPAPRRRGGRG